MPPVITSQEVAEHHIDEHPCNAGCHITVCPCHLVWLLHCNCCQAILSIKLPKRSEHGWCLHAEEVYQDACRESWLFYRDEKAAV